MMNFFKRFVVFIYALLMVGVGAIFFLVGLNLILPEQWLEIVGVVNSTMSFQMTFLVIGVIFTIIGLMAPYRLEKTIQKKRIVAFQNPDGEVTVSISAIEEYIRKIAKNISGIKDIRSRVFITRKGINIVTDVSMIAGANIPQITERIQMEVKNKVQVMLGVEEKISVKIHIKRIAKSETQGDELGQSENFSSSAIPYREIG
ncbi:MAG: alkaline shock response membrane anchor protein AmaP [Candidatus Omnitrophica bacterium]|nr:alkaline shock response membrane anchor protein AmaP [Candidatus Omnitrophota bacterium]